MKKKSTRLPLSSWKIEPKYSNNVLIGNWLEDRLKHGVGKDFLLGHHGRAYHPSQKSNYDLSYSRWFYDHPPGSGPLVDMFQPRRWHRHNCSWFPEKIDITTEGPFGIHGLIEKLKNKWTKDKTAAKDKNVYNTVQRESYVQIPPVKIDQEVTLRFRHRKTDIGNTPLGPRKL